VTENPVQESSPGSALDAMRPGLSEALDAVTGHLRNLIRDMAAALPSSLLFCGSPGLQVLKLAPLPEPDPNAGLPEGTYWVES
jgi:hypothetical protein